ncbi:M16 family metallopeptidase [Penaeicola halotolerans]|uniref:M16 family metallopeptidase n=1 Tax=Penaeicola halotolerans TaxID=2793196 RepID=UPI001CF8F11A|nr:pitrilysin family protein [Penaeicola halotolerans]
MKKTLLYICAGLLTFSTAFGQGLDRSVRPESGPAPEIQIGQPATFTLANGLKVFVVENDKLPRVSFSLTIPRDPVLEKDKAGLSSMVSQLMNRGTTTRTKEQLDEEKDFIGASVSASSSGGYGSSLKKHQDKMLELMTDLLYNPAFPEEELDKIKKQALSGIALQKNDPNAIASNIVRRLVYGDHPYGELDSEETLNNITVEDIKNYYKTYFKPSNAYLVIVGDITKKEAEQVAKKHFSKWPKGTIPTFEYEKPKAPAKTMVALHDRPSSVQSVINVSYPIELSLNSPDYIKTRVLSYILGGGSSSRMFMNLREDKGYTYGAYASIGSDRLVAAVNASASVRTEVTDSAVYEIMYELRRIVDEKVTQEELDAAKAYLSGSFGRSLESPSTIAGFALNVERYNLPKDFYANYLKSLDAVTIEDVQQVAKKYIRPDNAYIVIVGNTGEFKDKVARFGEVKMYDIYGNEEVPSDSKIDASVTAESVINKYIDAIGGRAKLEAIKSVEMITSAEIQGMTIETTTLKEQPGKLALSVKVGGNTVQNVVLNGDKAKISSGGQSQMLEGAQVAPFKSGALIFPELDYLKEGYKLVLEDIKSVEGKDAYRVKVSVPGGVSMVEYYDVESGLKLQTESAQGNAIYRDYKAVEGVLFSFFQLATNPQIPMPLETKVTSLKVNTQIDAATFKVD